jgi:hypothetical protein
MKIRRYPALVALSSPPIRARSQERAASSGETLADPSARRELAPAPIHAVKVVTAQELRDGGAAPVPVSVRSLANRQIARGSFGTGRAGPDGSSI